MYQTTLRLPTNLQMRNNTLLRYWVKKLVLCIKGMYHYIIRKKNFCGGRGIAEFSIVELTRLILNEMNTAKSFLKIKKYVKLIQYKLIKTGQILTKFYQELFEESRISEEKKIREHSHKIYFPITGIRPICIRLQVSTTKF